MANYDPQAWQVPLREAAWDQGLPSAGFNNPMPPQSQQIEQTAFNRQIEEIERAYENLMKNGKVYSMPFRRDSMPIMGGPPAFQDYAPRMSHRHSVDYDQMRPRSNSNVQGFYASQRQQSKPSETEQVMQAKRRMAAQRERELRNYHQEQQYNRNVNVQGRSDGSLSPNTMTEDDRRELIARQRRALYGNDAPYCEQEGNPVRASQPASGHNNAAGGRGTSPREYGSFSRGQGQSHNADEPGQLNPGEQNQQAQKRPSPKPQGVPSQESAASPASNQTSQTFGIFDNTAQQSSRTSTSSPGGSPSRQGKSTVSSVAPIGTRPAQANNPAFANRQSGTPSQSPLSHGYTANNESLNIRGGGNDRAPSSASNPTSGAPREQPTSAWGTSSGVWGNNGNNKTVGAVWA